MTKKIMSIFLCFSITTVQLFAGTYKGVSDSSIIYQESNLPQIPVYIIDNESLLDEFPMYYVEKDYKSSFYSLEVNHIKTRKGISKLAKRLTFLAQFILAYSVSNNIETLNNEEKLGATFAIGSILNVIRVSGFENINQKKTSWYNIKLKDKNNNSLYSKNIKLSDDGKLFSLKGKGLFVGMSWYPAMWLFSYFPGMIQGMTITPTNLNQEPVHLGYLKKSPVTFLEEMHSKYYSTYNNFIDLSISSPDFSQIHKVKENILSTLGKPRGEFETSSEYSNRLELEAIVRESAEKEYQNNYNDISRSFKNDNEIKFNKIDEDLSKIFIRPLDSVALSKYDADEEIFIVTSQSNNYSKNYIFKVSIPIHDAPAFKENISNLAFQSVLNPTMDGNWNNIESQVKLIDTKTDVSIPLMPINDY